MSDLVDPRILAELSDLKFIARKIISGGGYGLHNSRQRGVGMEFSQYRAYQPGDDLRQVDWKLYARSDKVFVRESDRESHQTIWFLMDQSASMGQTSGQIANWSKFRYGQCMTAALANLVHRQGDRFGLMGLNGDSFDFLPSGAGPRHLDQFLLYLDRMNLEKLWPDETILLGLWEQMHDADLVVLVTDFFEQESEINQLISKLAAAGKELLIIQLLTQDEVDFPYSGRVTFIDRETGENVEVSGKDYGDHYRATFRETLRIINTQVAGLGAQYQQVLIEKPLDRSLKELLKARSTTNTRRAQ